MASATEDTNHHPHKKAAWRATRDLSDSLIGLPRDYPMNRMIGVSEAHEAAQRMLFEYLTALEPKREHLGAVDGPEELDEDTDPPLWYQPIVSVAVPRSGTVRLNDANFLRNGVTESEILNRVRGRIPTEQVTLSLENLRPVWQTDPTVEIKLKGWVGHRGYQDRTIVKTRYMPVSAIIRVRRQLDDCMDSLGWLAGVNSTPRTQITKEMIEEVEEWRRRVLD